jgi:hypothetical protein
MKKIKELNEMEPISIMVEKCPGRLVDWLIEGGYIG